MKTEIKFSAFYKDRKPCIDVETSIDGRKDIILDSSEKTIALDINYKNIDNLKIKFKNKCDNENNSIKIISLKLDDIDMQHFIYQGKFYPEYNKNWYDQQTNKPPLFYKPGTEMRHNGVWILETKTPIWKMVMDQWLTDEGKNA